MGYPVTEELRNLVYQIGDFGNLMYEYGAEGVQELVDEAEKNLKTLLETVKKLPVNEEMRSREPDELAQIRALRPEGPRKMWKELDKDVYREKLEGALLSRLAGCILGVPVENWPVKEMEDWATFIGDVFPPVDYWSEIKRSPYPHHDKSNLDEYTKSKMTCAPVDDDITYTMLGLLIAEEYGVNFTTGDVGKAWMKYLPFAWTAEAITLNNLKSGIAAEEAADVDNPFCQWIGADIRSDPWAYMAPGNPEKAAELAYRDAYLSHRRNGIYGEMFFAAAQAAAFCTDNAIDAVKIGLTEIPADCQLAKDIRWALEVGPGIADYREARQLVDERFQGMPGVHTNNNACLTIFGLMLGGNDMSKVLSQTIAMGLDNDCTTATAGSIIGAIVGKKGVLEHWYKPFNNTVRTYINDREYFAIDDLLDRFTVLAEKVYAES